MLNHAKIRPSVLLLALALACAPKVSDSPAPADPVSQVYAKVEVGIELIEKQYVEGVLEALVAPDDLAAHADAIARDFDEAKMARLLRALQAARDGEAVLEEGRVVLRFEGGHLAFRQVGDDWYIEN